MTHVEIGADGACHAVHQRHGRIAERYPRHERAHHGLFSRLQVFSVSPRLLQIAGDELYGGKTK